MQLLNNSKKSLSWTMLSLRLQMVLLRQWPNLLLKEKLELEGLRSIIEKLLLDEMFEAPSRKDIEKIIIDKENVIDDIQPKMVLKQK